MSLKYRVSWPEKSLDRKEIKSHLKKSIRNPSLKSIFWVGFSAGHVIAWVGD